METVLKTNHNNYTKNRQKGAEMSFIAGERKAAFSFGHVKFEMSVQHPSKYIM